MCFSWEKNNQKQKLVEYHHIRAMFGLFIFGTVFNTILKMWIIMIEEWLNDWTKNIESLEDTFEKYKLF